MKVETKEKVLRTHACIIDTHKKSLETSAYFMSFLPGIIPDMENDNEVQGICPHCSANLDIYNNIETSEENLTRLNVNLVRLNIQQTNINLSLTEKAEGDVIKDVKLNG